MAPRATSLSARVARLPLPIHGRRIDLDRPRLENVGAIVRLMNDPSVARGTLHIPYPYTERHAREWVRKTSRERAAGRLLNLSILRRSDGALLGGVGLHQFAEESARAEVGYWLGREYRGNGYASEATDLLTRTAFARLGLHRVEARVYAFNVPSRRLALRCGFRYEGRLRDEVRKDGRWLSTLLFARLSTDPPPARRY